MVANRPVDMSEDFKKNGWKYCKYLITDPRSDVLMRRDIDNDTTNNNGTETD
jgi:hypothetical protein|tara:strand:- start:4310 stop:4465 length:156 start_codon:yes stop_codon:yes gene_type:complete